MTGEELRAKLASAILDELAFTKAEEPRLQEVIDQLIFDSPCDTIEVLINIRTIDRKTMLSQEMLSQARDAETLTVLGVRVVVDGKDSSERCGGPSAPNSYDYILQAPSKDSPP
jgi:hypothetical protein